MDSTLSRLARDGFAVVPDALGAAEIEDLKGAVDQMVRAAEDSARGGVRDLFRVLPAARELAALPGVRRWPAAVLGPACFAVRAILFDKTAESNWKVAWHQDLAIAVRERRELAGWGPWSVKAGVPHVQPPTAVLENMLTVRIHLDACDEENGPLRVLPGSHRDGKLSPSAIEEWKQRTRPVEIRCAAGALLLMHPLTLHASSASTRPAHRRVIHLEYAAGPLPEGLDWYERQGAASRGDSQNALAHSIQRKSTS